MTYVPSQQVRDEGLASGDPYWLADKAWRDEMAAKRKQSHREKWMFRWLWEAMGIGGIALPVTPERFKWAPAGYRPIIAMDGTRGEWRIRHGHVPRITGPSA